VLWFLPFINFFGSTWLGLIVERLWIVLLGLAVVLVCAALLHGTHCPRCGWPVYRHRATLAGVEGVLGGGR
jgi:hypothetical protein